MIDTEVLLALKQKHGPLYNTQVKGFDLLFKELTFAQYDEIVTIQNSEGYSSADAEDIILQRTIVYPENFDIYKIPAGAISALSQEILDASGFASARVAKRVLEKKRNEANEVRFLMKAFVLATIHTYSPEDLDNMTFSELSSKVVLAEKIIEVQQSVYGIEPTSVKLDLIDPEEEQRAEAEAAARFNSSRKTGEAKYEDPVAHKLWGSG